MSVRGGRTLVRRFWSLEGNHLLSRGLKVTRNINKQNKINKSFNNVAYLHVNNKFGTNEFCSTSFNSVLNK